MKPFVFQHIYYKEWAKKLKARNVKTITYTDRQKPWYDTECAAAFLAHCREMVYGYQELNNEVCVVAKLITDGGNYALLKVDRDYFEICTVTKNGADKGCVWQLASQLNGFSMFELWANMLRLLDDAEKTAPD